MIISMIGLFLLTGLLTGCTPQQIFSVSDTAQHPTGQDLTNTTEDIAAQSAKAKQNDTKAVSAKAQHQADQRVSKTAKNKKEKVKVYYLNVGQGSSVLVESSGRYLLIDGGDRDASSFVVSYLKKKKIHTLDYVIATHYDADHLNGVVGALHAFRVKKVIAPSYTTDTKVYRSFVQAIATQKISRTHPVVGKKYRIGKAAFTIVAPNGTGYTDENDYSVAIRLVNGKNRFLFTGDAQEDSEYEMTENGQNLRSDVYMAGHHGSAHSSTSRFLQAVKPKYVVISDGADNTYGHPSQDAMARFKSMHCKMFRTDVQGTVIATGNGSKITWNVKPCTDWSYRVYGSSQSVGGSREATPQESASVQEERYIGNVNSKKYHRPSCSGLPLEKNRIYFSNITEAQNAGYHPCGLCHPDR